LPSTVLSPGSSSTRLSHCVASPQPYIRLCISSVFPKTLGELSVFSPTSDLSLWPGCRHDPVLVEKTWGTNIKAPSHAIIGPLGQPRSDSVFSLCSFFEGKTENQFLDLKTSKFH
jgi:hypothetical protein